MVGCKVNGRSQGLHKLESLLLYVQEGCVLPVGLKLASVMKLACPTQIRPSSCPTASLGLCLVASPRWGHPLELAGRKQKLGWGSPLINRAPWGSGSWSGVEDPCRVLGLEFGPWGGPGHRQLSVRTPEPGPHAGTFG